MALVFGGRLELPRSPQNIIIQIYPIQRLFCLPLTFVEVTIGLLFGGVEKYDWVEKHACLIPSFIVMSVHK